MAYPYDAEVSAWVEKHRRELVWRAWTEEKEPLKTNSFDVREGGRYRYTMVNIESGEEYHTGGEFLEGVPSERLVFTWATSVLPSRTPLS